MTTIWRIGPVCWLIAFPAVAADVAQQFLNVPVWYLTYKVTVTCRDGATGSDGSSWSVNMERATTGSAQLGIRSQGPSLSLASGAAPTQDQALFDAIEQYANWIGGVVTDENKSPEEQDAEQLQALQANQKAVETFRLVRETAVAGAVTEGTPAAGLERECITEAGSAPVTCLGDFHLEIDGAKKKYKFKFASGFADTEQSTTAVTGEKVQHLGTPSEHRLPIETALCAGTPQPASGGPAGGVIEGDLPSPFGNIAGSPSYPVRLQTPDGYRGTLTIQFVLSPTPPERVELIIEPPAEYDKWRPVGGENEERAADFVPLNVRLQKQGGGVPKTKAWRFKYRLVDTSHEKGVCMNWPLRPLAKTPYDLQFEPARNPGHDVLDDDRQSAAKDGEHLTQDKVIVSCFDYGASSQFTAEAFLDDGRTILGTVKGTQLEYLNLPKRKANSRIADVFLQDNGATGLADQDDAENDPVGDGFKGDGLTLFEEYRGFKHGDGWVTGDPKSKDLFVLNVMRGMKQVKRGISIFETVTRLNVHSLLKSHQVNDAMVINFNFTDAPHVVDQHVIRILASQQPWRGAAFVEEVGTPGTARAVRMPVAWEEFRTVGNQTYESFAATIAHEMLHACNVHHHGQADQVVSWLLLESPDPHVIEVDGGNETPITLKREDGTVIKPRDLFPPTTTNRHGYERVFLGVPHGQHSGDEDCLMRYDCSWGYVSKADPNVRYLADESTGMGLCVGTAGTGVNSPSHRPQSRYDSAASPGGNIRMQRGKCKFQFRVNDLGEEPKR